MFIYEMTTFCPGKVVRSVCLLVSQVKNGMMFEITIDTFVKSVMIHEYEILLPHRFGEAHKESVNIFFE